MCTLPARRPTLPAALAIALVSWLLPAGPALAGSPAADSRPHIDEARLADLPTATVCADLVAVVRVAGVAEVAAADRSWGGREDLPDADFARSEFGGDPVVRQIDVEIEKPLKAGQGLKDLKKASFRLATARVKLGAAPPAETIIVRGWYDRCPYGVRRARALTHARYRLAQGQRQLLFLREVTPAGTGAGQGRPAERQFVLLDPPLADAPEEAVARVEGTLKQIADWEKPAPPPAEIAAGAGKLIAQLGSADYQAREDATKALVAMGLPAKALLDEALENQDAEVRERCRKILEAIKPEVLRSAEQAAGAEVDGGFGDVDMEDVLE